MALLKGFDCVYSIWSSPQYLIFSIISEIKVHTCPVNQPPTVRQTHFTGTQISYTKANFTPEQSICALGDLIMSSLTFLTVSVQTSLSLWKFLLLVSFLSWVEGLLVSVCCPSLYVTLWILNISHTLQGSVKQILMPFVSCPQGFRLKVSWRYPFLTFTKGTLIGRLQWNLGRVALNWGLAIVLLD